MPHTTPKQNSLIGGIVLCAFPAVILFAMYLDGARLPMPFPILFGLFFLYGLRLVIWGVFKLDLDNAASWLVDAVAAAGFAVLAFWIARHWTQGWSGDLPFVPESWNQNIAQIIFACAGLLATAFAARLLWKAVNRYRGRPDDGVTHV
jgi:hypothetical protein